MSLMKALLSFLASQMLLSSQSSPRGEKCGIHHQLHLSGPPFSPRSWPHNCPDDISNRCISLYDFVQFSSVLSSRNNLVHHCWRPLPPLSSEKRKHFLCCPPGNTWLRCCVALQLPARPLPLAHCTVVRCWAFSCNSNMTSSFMPQDHFTCSPLCLERFLYLTLQVPV